MRSLFPTAVVLSLFAILPAPGPAVEVAAAERTVPLREATLPVRSLPLAQRRAVVEGLSEPLLKLKVVDLDGRDVSEAIRPREEGGKVTIDLPTTDAIVLKPREIRTEVLRGEGRTVLPGGAVIPLVPKPDSGGAAQVVWFRLTLAASPMPAPWEPALGQYQTRLSFGLQRPPSAPAGLRLDRPVTVKIDFQGLDSPAGTTVTIEEPGIENEKTVILPFTPLTARPTLLVRSSISDVNLELTALPRLDVKPARDTMLGLGLDTVPVIVTRVTPDGRREAVAAPTPLAVAVTGRARIKEDNATLDGGTAETRVTLRSAGLGETVLQVSADGVVGHARVHQRFPTGPLAAALLGGALGGLARRFVKGARRSLTGRRIAEGLVVASIAFVAGVLGVGQLGLPAAVVATEAGAFLTGALTGFAGVSAIEALTKKAAPASS
jgi:hypothetical protein